MPRKDTKTLKLGLKMAKIINFCDFCCIFCVVDGIVPNSKLGLAGFSVYIFLKSTAKLSGSATIKVSRGDFNVFWLRFYF